MRECSDDMKLHFVYLSLPLSLVVFQMYDTDKDGRISKNDLERVMM